MPQTTWIDDVRGVLKREHGKGWSVQQQSGKIKLVRRVPGQSSKQAITTQLPWRASSQTKLLSLVVELRQKMEDLGLSMADAHKLMVVTPEAVPGQLDWEEVARRYEQQRVLESSQSTFDREERHKVAKALAVLSKKRGAPKDGNALFTAYSLQHFGNLPPGKDGRKRHLLDLSNLLEFAVNKCGADKQWLPPAKADQGLMLGTRMDPPAATVAILPEQLEGLLHSLDDKPELRLAVALIGLYGLRPAELMVLFLEDGDLKVGNVKRNRKTAKNPKPPRLALPLDLLSMPGEGQRVLQLFASGLVQLPTSIRNAKDFKSCGHAFRQYLDRHPYWQSLVAARPGLIPYSLRHGYAWRGSRYYDRPVPIRDLAGLMGHDPKTHHKHYGAWTRDEDKKESVRRAVGDLVSPVGT